MIIFVNRQESVEELQRAEVVARGELGAAADEIAALEEALEEAEADCRQMARAGLIATIPATWQEWLRHNRDRGCAREGMIERATQEGGFSRAAIDAVLDQPAAEVVAVAKPF